MPGIGWTEGKKHMWRRGGAGGGAKGVKWPFLEDSIEPGKGDQGNP